MYATIVELDALADTVRATAQDHDFRAIVGRVGFTLVFIGGIHVGGVGRKFCRTGVHTLVDRVHVEAMAQLADFAFRHASQLGQARIGKAFTLERAQEISVQAVDARFGNLLFQTHQLFNLHQEPAVDVSQVEHAIDGQTGAESIGDVPDTIGTRILQLTTDLGQGFRIVQAHFRIKPGRAHFQAAQRFLQ
ncbi:hypothetical protein D3C73_686170 [compost metagenome]